MPDYKEQRCPDCPCRDPDFVSGAGDPNPDIVLIGKGPAITERATGEPFAGISGRLLHDSLNQLREDFKPVTTFETNAYLCFPQTEAEEESAVRTCKKRLLQTLRTMKPKVIVPMGEEAQTSLLAKGKVMPNLWKLHPIAELDFPHTPVPNFNPAYILRNPHQYRTFTDALGCAIGVATGERVPLPLPETKIAETQEDILDFLDELRNETELGLDLETTDLNPYTDRILTLILSPPPKGNQFRSYIIPWRLVTDKTEMLPNFFAQIPNDGPGFQAIKDYLEGPRTYRVMNATFDQSFLTAAGISIKISGDPMLLHYAIDERTGLGASHGLKQLSSQYFGTPDWETDIWRFLKSKNDSFENIPEDVLHEYCQWDTPYVYALEDALTEVADEGELKLYKEVLLPHREMLASAQARGVYMDIPGLLKTRRDIKEDLDKLEASLQHLCGLPLLNPASTQQVQDVLFKDFNLQRPVDDDGIYMSGAGEPVLLAMLKQNQAFMKEVERLNESTDVTDLVQLVQVLADIDYRWAFVVGILVYRDSKKDITTYLDGVAKFISPFDRCIHPFMHVTGTDTGRFTGSRPSLLNVKNSNRIKRPYSARPGYKFGYADQSQMELRVFACVTRDQKLADLLIESDARTDAGEQAADIHSLIAKLVFPYYHQAPKWWRSIVKTIVYGVLYGRSAYAIAKKHRLEVSDAENYHKQIMDLFPKTTEYREYILMLLKETNEVTTEFGRRKRFPFIPNDRRLFTHIKNSAGNMPIQSTASDINSFSMYDIWMDREETDIHPLFPIHDAVTFEIPEDRVDESLAYISKVMSDTPVKYLGEEFAFVPFRVEPKAGDNWGEVDKEESFFSQILSLVEAD